ncbi:MAG: alkane 1-monooxygenase [Flavobacteriaceae bacterium]
MKDVKYLLAYTIPLSCWAALSLKGWFSYTTVVYAFGLIPMLELVFSSKELLYSDEQKQRRLVNVLFDLLLYLNLPLVFATLFYGLYTLLYFNLEVYEQIGIVFSVGIVLGTNGINVAHELGHRLSKSEQFLAKVLLLPSLYMHFFIEHNLGHHKNVGTPEDPATARRDQSVYGFWWTSIIGQWISAYRIQQQQLAINGQQFWSSHNELLVFIGVQSLYIFAVYVLFGAFGAAYALAFALVAVLLLETINYIEHYGLVRELKASRYERVTPAHSWNSNHVIGRMVLYELTRHSDHHHRASKKYQVLESIEKSPQLPFGYTTSMVIAMVPPVWFALMNKRLNRI